jgi:hypothetical protein
VAAGVVLGPTAKQPLRGVDRLSPARLQFGLLPVLSREKILRVLNLLNFFEALS